jgi:hypothetical protein
VLVAPGNSLVVEQREMVGSGDMKAVLIVETDAASPISTGATGLQDQAIARDFVRNSGARLAAAGIRQGTGSSIRRPRVSLATPEVPMISRAASSSARRRARRCSIGMPP